MEDSGEIIQPPVWPSNGQFVKGHDPRRNLTGGPKTKPLTEALERQLTTKECDRIARAMIRQAGKGSVSHFESVADRVEGPVARAEAESSKTTIQVVILTGDA